jgi:DNA-binding CsgD family transcriptional regulator
MRELVRLALAADDVATARKATQVALADADAGGAAADRLDAVVCESMVEHDAASLLSAADAYDALGRGPAMAFALTEAGVRLAARDVPSARAACTRALQVYEAIGATQDRTYLYGRMRRLGVQLGQRGAARRTSTGWGSLTRAELTVVTWVVRGESNPEIARRLFLSSRTVDSHVSNVLRKLNISNRIEIAREAARQEGSMS